MHLKVIFALSLMVMPKVVTKIFLRLFIFKFEAVPKYTEAVILTYSCLPNDNPCSYFFSLAELVYENMQLLSYHMLK